MTKDTHEVAADATFAVLPTWVLDADVSATAVRLYAVLRRYADADGRAWPSRATLAKRMRCSRDTIDRAVKELVSIDALAVHRRWTDQGEPTSSLYLLRSVPVDNSVGVAAWVRPPTRTDATRVGAGVRHKPEPGEPDPQNEGSSGLVVEVAQPRGHERAARSVQHCGEPECDERTRMRTTDDERVVRCPLCHPAVAGKL